MKKLVFRILINSFLGLVLIVIWSRFVNLSTLGTNLSSANLAIILPAFLFFFVISGFLRAARLKLILKKYPLPYKDILMINFLSQFLSFMIPIRAGEIAKSVYFSTQYKLPFGQTVIWVFIDRFLDFLVVLLLIGGLVLFVPTGLPTVLIKTIFIILAAFLAVFIIALKSEVLLKGLVKVLSSILIFPAVKQKFLSFTSIIIEGFAVLQAKPQELFVLILITAVATVSDSLIWLFAFSSMGVNLGFYKSLLGNCLAALTFLIPSAPGYVGSAEAAGLGVFSGVLKMDANLVSAVSVIYHALTLLVVLIFGITSLYILKFDLKLVWKKFKTQKSNIKDQKLD